MAARRRSRAASGPRAPRDDRKLRQLCAQIRRSVELTLVGDCEDEVLQNMSVESVEPAPGNRLQVMLTVHPPGSAMTRAEVLARLELARPLLLHEIARSVNRRNLPEISFWLVKEGGTPGAPDAAREPDMPDMPDMPDSESDP